MTSEEWQSVWSLFRAANGLPPAEQRSFVTAAPAAPRVIEEVLALLDEHELESGYSRPEPGMRFGRYTIRKMLGQGGTGEVFSAWDGELGRLVALKFLNRQARLLPTAVDLLIWEAQAASALNHPNLVTVHDVLRTESVTALVTEFVEGESLRLRCGAPTPVPLVARWGAQIARGLAAAHAGRIVHGDIKPENVIVRLDGYVKILDFGLAQHSEVPKDSGDALAGTAGYMSPEQTRGEYLTPASDIFCLGVVLYELAAGKHPFLEGTVSATTRAISEREAVLPTQMGELPGNKEFAGALTAMLRKDPSSRPTAAAIAEQLDRIASATAQTRWKKWIAIAAAAPLVLAFAIVYRMAPGTDRPIEAPQSAAVTHYAGVESQPVFSHDGSRIAFVWSGPDSQNRDIYIKTIGQEDLRQLTTHPLDDISPAWSPDGSTIAFLRRAGDGGDSLVLTIPAAGGPERVVGRVEDPQGYNGLAWWPDSQSLITRDGGSGGHPLARLYLRDRHKESLTTSRDGQDCYPVVSLDRRQLAFVRNESGSASVCLAEISGASLGVTACSPRSGQINSLAWLSSAGLLLSEGRGLSQLRIENGRVTGESKVLDGEFISLSGDRQGRRFVFSRRYSDNNIWRFDVATRKTVRFIASSEEDSEPEFSPDGSRIVFRSSRSGGMELYVQGRDGSDARQLTSFNAHTGSARWSPDGTRIVFDGTRIRGPADRVSAFTNLYIVPAGGGAARQITDDRAERIVPNWSSDGRWIYYTLETAERREAWKLPADGGPSVKVSGTEMFDIMESDDGRWLYYTKPRTAKGVWRRPAEGGLEALVPGTEGLSYRYWQVRGRELAFVRGGSDGGFAVLPLAGGAARALSSGPRQWFKGPRGMTVSPDGATILYTQEDLTLGDILMFDLATAR